MGIAFVDLDERYEVEQSRRAQAKEPEVRTALESVIA